MNTWEVLTLDAEAESRRSLACHLIARGYPVGSAASIGDLLRRLERRKLGTAQGVIAAERGVGYRLDCDVVHDAGNRAPPQVDV